MKQIKPRCPDWPEVNEIKGYCAESMRHTYRWDSHIDGIAVSAYTEIDEVDHAALDKTALQERAKLVLLQRAAQESKK